VQALRPLFDSLRMHSERQRSQNNDAARHARPLVRRAAIDAQEATPVIRLTEAQYRMLDHRDDDRKPRRTRTQRERSEMPENVLERQITDTLAAHGYVNLRLHSGVYVPLRLAGTLAAVRNIVRIGTVGMPDWLSLRPALPPGSRVSDGPHFVKAVYWECKAPGRKPRPEQLAWLERHQQCGFEATWFHQFEPDERPESCEARDSHCFLRWFRDYFLIGGDR
jgi:hypothetical protein